MIKELFDKNIKSKQYSPFLAETQNLAAKRFNMLGFPTVKLEDWRYSNLKKLHETDFEINSEVSLTSNDLKDNALLNFGTQKIVFVNGIFSAELSNIDADAKIQILSVAQAKEKTPELLETHFGKYAAYNNDGLTCLNIAADSDGAVIYLAKNACIETPIVIQNISDARVGTFASNVHHMIIADVNSEAKFVEIYQTIGEKPSFENALTEILIEKDAKLDYYKIQNQNDATYHVGTTQVSQHDKSYFYAATITLNGGFIRNNLNVVLEGQHIENHLYGLYIPNGSQHIDNHSIVDHKYPNCQSNELYKGVLSDKSTGVFNGKIFVREDAQKTNAYQNCRNVITSDTASMNAKPQLEIWADDVKCSHGTTTGQLNDEAIFYMQSRGIPKLEAIKLQLVAFAEDIVSQLKISELKEILEVYIEDKLA